MFTVCKKIQIMYYKFSNLKFVNHFKKWFLKWFEFISWIWAGHLDSYIILFTEYLDDLLIHVSRQAIFCVGDFNIDLLDDASSADLCNVMYSRNIFPLINIASRITDTTAKCLDHIWCNRTNTFFSGAFEEDISDRYPIFAVLNITKDNKPVKKSYPWSLRSECECLYLRYAFLCSRFLWKKYA